MSIGSIVNKKVGVKQIIVAAGSSEAELEMWVDAAANGQWVQAIPRQKGIGGFFLSSSEQECTIRIDAAPGIIMHCSAIQEITGFTGGGAGGGAAPPPAAGEGTPPPAEAGPPADSGGGGGEDSGGGCEESGGGESNCAGSYYNRGYGRVNRGSYSSKVRYY
jgi:hypothetical protein